uniref:trypsin-like peptidase domain-containing protein n=1 Tax=Candidatus Electronema sp. TaxID=2698783 RepID=UPI00405612BD
MKLRAVLAACLLLCAAEPQAHEIHLKNGKIIETETVWRQGDAVLYEKYGGTITLPAHQVQEISYAKNQKAVETPTASSNLAGQLRERLQPKTPLEEASLRTLAVKTVVGFGSGFFISENGLIVTNKHVVRGSEEDTAQIRKQIDQFSDEIGEYGRQLGQLRKSIDQRQSDIRRHREILREAEMSGRADERQLALRKKELDAFEASLAADEKRYREAQRDYDSVKGNADRQAEQFRDGQRQLARQDSFEVILADQTKLHAKLCAISPEHDLALLQIEDAATPRLEPVKRDSLTLGQQVYALGSPADLSLQNTVTSGVLSGFRANFIQTNAQIYPGNSGGPLIDEQGRVIGVNTMKELTRKFEGLGFAIPIETVFAEFKEHLPESD